MAAPPAEAYNLAGDDDLLQFGSELDGLWLPDDGCFLEVLDGAHSDGAVLVAPGQGFMGSSSPWRCIAADHSGLCTACVPPPSIDDESLWELVSDAGKNNGTRPYTRL